MKVKNLLRSGGLEVVVFLAAALLFLTGTTARADTVTITLQNPIPALTFNYKLNGAAGSVRAGALHWHNPGAQGGLPTHFISFCDELTQYVGIGGTYTYHLAEVEDTPFGGPGTPTPGHGMGGAKADLIRELFGTYWGSIHDASTEAAFQISIWEIVNDTGLNIYKGNFKAKYDGAPPSFVGLADTWLKSLGQDLPGHSYAPVVALSSGTNQDQLTIAPAPPAFVLFGIGALGLLAYRRRGRALVA